MIRQWLFYRHLNKRLDELKSTLNPDDYKRAKKAATFSNSGKVLQQTQRKSGEYPVLQAIYQFLVENWDEILFTLLKFAPLLLDERHSKRNR